MTTIPTTGDYSAVAAILKDSGFSARDLRGGQYDAMVQAIIFGDPITIQRGSDGKADVTISGIDATSDMFRVTGRPDDCPDYLPAALCKGNAALQKGITDILGAPAKAGIGVLSKSADLAVAAVKTPIGDAWLRTSLIAVGSLMVLVGIIFLLIPTAKKNVGALVKGVGKGTALGAVEAVVS